MVNLSQNEIYALYGLFTLVGMEIIYSIVIITKITDTNDWHNVASKGMLLTLLLVAIIDYIYFGNTLTVVIWVTYLLFLIHKSNRYIFKSITTKE